MNKALIVSTLLIIMTLSLVSADISIPTKTNVYFEKSGQPYNGQVDFEVKCYGYHMGMPPLEKEAGTYTPEEVFKFSATYNKYGDVIDEVFYMNYKHIDYCDLEGKTNGENFTIKNYSTSPVNFEKCTERVWGNRKCELRFDIPRSNLDKPTPQNKGFWESFGCFFKKIFGKTC